MLEEIKKLIRDVPDFPKPGILFRDITPLLKDAHGLRMTVEELCRPHLASPPRYVAGIESRGFIFASAMALRLGCGCLLIRKPGKLPAKTRSASYQLEYGEDRIEIHEDSVVPGDRVVIVDDLLATGGTMAAAAGLLQGLGATLVELAFVVELGFLDGRKKVAGFPVRSLITY